MAEAIGMVELISIARGIFTADQMMKTAEVELVTAATVCPGKYIIIVSGDTASVQNAVDLGEQTAGEYYVDSMIIPHVSPGIFPAIAGTSMPEVMGALGIVESFSLATMIIVADAILKTADLEPLELRLGVGLGGKGFFTFTGDVAAVEIGAAAGMAIAEKNGLLVNAEIIPAPSAELVSSLW